MGPARKSEPRSGTERRGSDPAVSVEGAAEPAPSPEPEPAHAPSSDPPPVSRTMGVRPNVVRELVALREALKTQAPKPPAPAQPVTTGETPEPPAPEPPAPAATMGETPEPPAQPATTGETPKPPTPPEATPESSVTPVPIAQAVPAAHEPLPAVATPLPVPAVIALPAEPEAPADPLPDPAARAAPLSAKPLLASEALMEDLAPVEPARGAARLWCAWMGAAFLIFGCLPLFGLVPGHTDPMGAPIPWFVTGAIALVASITRVTYRQRAVAMVVLGVLSGVVALHGAGGALVRADGSTAWGLARLFAAIAIPAALLFRARYRAYAGARVFLGAALLVSLPFAVHTAWNLAGSGGVAQAGAVVVLLVLVGSLTGFMGSETTGAGAYLAPATVITLACELALRALGGSSRLGAATGAVAFAGAAGLASLGVFQILAWRFAADARRIDIHRVPRESRPPASDRDPASDWSTRE
jgi:hypothetical protein